MSLELLPALSWVKVHRLLCSISSPGNRRTTWMHTGGGRGESGADGGSVPSSVVPYFSAQGRRGKVQHLGYTAF